MKLSSSALALLICLPSTSAIDHRRVNRRRMSGDRRDRHGGRMSSDRTDRNRTFLGDNEGGCEENEFLDLSDLIPSSKKSGKSGKTGKLPASIVPVFFKVGGGGCRDAKMDYYDIVGYEYDEEDARILHKSCNSRVLSALNSPPQMNVTFSWKMDMSCPEDAISCFNDDSGTGPIVSSDEGGPETCFRYNLSPPEFTLVGNDECVDRNRKGRLYSNVGFDQDLDDNEPEGCAARCTANYPVQGLVGFTYKKYPQARCECQYSAGIGFQYKGIPKALAKFRDGAGVGEVKDKIPDTSSALSPSYSKPAFAVACGTEHTPCLCHSLMLMEEGPIKDVIIARCSSGAGDTKTIAPLGDAKRKWLFNHEPQSNGAWAEGGFASHRKKAPRIIHALMVNMVQHIGGSVCGRYPSVLVCLTALGTDARTPNTTLGSLPHSGGVREEE
ncbi:hypothetical protein THAOC_05033 [Thalassiosira oceanica]|uniref:Uncharacterized protein n=1 Tax=Thalassiosira oceanica TaxID=159749 RepID=K0TNA8_THAOC|nr:hypothetical protein THAOC_05033 [Thalassiosira oceanica]|eukprot:EJK73347.1 hypothetical protein THAOC_05033 [Thalassiosira oceanica]